MLSRLFALLPLLAALWAPTSVFSQIAAGRDLSSIERRDHPFAQSGAVVARNVKLIGKWPSNPSNQISIYSLDVIGSYAYVAACVNGVCGLQVIDISAPEHPIARGFVESTFRNIAAFESETAQQPGVYAYLGRDIVNVSLPDSPMVVGVLANFAVTSKVEVVGNTAYFGRGRELRVLDISNPANPRAVGTFVLGDEDLKNVLVVGNFAYTNWLEDGGHFAWEYFRVIDVSEPTNAFQVAIAHYAFGSNLTGPDIPYLNARAVKDEFLYASTAGISPTYEGIWIYDIADPVNIVRVGTYEVPGGQVGEIVVAGNQAFVAAGGAGLRVLDVSDPVRLTEVGYYRPGRSSWNVVLAGSNVALADRSAVYILRFVVPAGVDITPKTLNLRPRARWIHAHIELPEPYDVRDIDIRSILLNDSVPAEPHPTSQRAARDDNGLTVKFSWQAVADILAEGDEVEIKVSGWAAHSYFEGIKTIRVIRDRDAGGLSPVEKGPHDTDRILLHQNYPNPFNPTTTISVTIPEQTHISLSIVDVRGRIVRTLINEVVAKGPKEIHWDGRDGRGDLVSSGVYFYRLVAGDEVLTRKMAVLKELVLSSPGWTTLELFLSKILRERETQNGCPGNFLIVKIIHCAP